MCSVFKQACELVGGKEIESQTESDREWREGEREWHGLELLGCFTGKYLIVFLISRIKVVFNAKFLWFFYCLSTAFVHRQVKTQSQMVHTR